MGTLALAVDFAHALAMFVWMLGLPLLLWHRWPRLSRAFAVYAVFFIVISQLSHWLLGECVLTTVARWVWEEGAAPSGYDEWFTVRFARAVFGASPSHREIVWISEALIFLTAVGALFTLKKAKRGARGTPEPSAPQEPERTPA